MPFEQKEGISSQRHLSDDLSPCLYREKLLWLPPFPEQSFPGKEKTPFTVSSTRPVAAGENCFSSSVPRWSLRCSFLLLTLRAIPGWWMIPRMSDLGVPRLKGSLVSMTTPKDASVVVSECSPSALLMGQPSFLFTSKFPPKRKLALSPGCFP